MTFPVSINVIVNFSTGPVFASPMILDQGLLGTNVLADAAAFSVDISSQVLSVNTQRGRNLTADQFQAGTLQLRIADQNGDWNPQNTSGPYYNLLSPMRKITVTATYLGVTYPIFAGYIESYNTSIPNNIDGNNLAITTINAVDAFRLANLATVTTVAGTSAGQTTGARMNAILNQISWPTSMRQIDTGLTTCQVDPGTSRSALGAMLTVATTEYGALYVNANGSFTFHDRHVTSSSVADPATSFSDDGLGGILYYDAKWALSDILIYNQANITATGLAMQSATNAASIEQYFAHTYTASGLLMEDTATALNYARSYVASRAQTSVRCDYLLLDLYTQNYDLGIKAALQLDFFDPVTIQTSQPGSTSITKTEQIFGVSHAITPGSWKTTFLTAEAIIDAFILDSTMSGVLDTSALSY